MRASCIALPSTSMRIRMASATSTKLLYPRTTAPIAIRTLAICNATEDDDFESLFAKELKRRGMEGKEGDPAADVKKDPFQSGSTKTKTRAPPPSSAFTPGEQDDQRKRSVSLVNEGLEGLIPRVSQLFTLGGSLFLGFLPFMLAFSLLFTGIFAVWGESFLHGGRPSSGPPPYIDPQTLLSNPTVDPYVPY